MIIRPYQPGDEAAQVAIYNASAAALPGFKPASEEEVERRYRTGDADPTAKFYAVEGGEVVGYAVFNPNGRISYPWCRSGAEDVQPPLLDAMLAAMRERGLDEAWTAYRGDWRPVLDFFQTHGFEPVRTVINYVAPLAGLPRSPIPEGQTIRALESRDLPQVVELGQGLFGATDLRVLESSFFANPYFDASACYALTPEMDADQILGAALVVSHHGYADPTKIDASMPCFRLGALGTEWQRHKRVNGLFSCVFAHEADGVTLLAEAVRRLENEGLSHIAAQAPSDQPAQIALYDRYFQRQGSFPILRGRLDATIPAG
jgi:L-amino acid N-acyltransferase YncA